VSIPHFKDTTPPNDREREKLLELARYFLSTQGYFGESIEHFLTTGKLPYGMEMGGIGSPDLSGSYDRRGVYLARKDKGWAGMRWSAIRKALRESEQLDLLGAA
jgi:hypothetical protein